VSTGQKLVALVGLAALGAYLYTRARRAQQSGADALGEIDVTASRLEPGDGEGSTNNPAGLGPLDYLDVIGSRIGQLIMSRGYRNNNPGNIRFIADAKRAWHGQVSDDNGYGVYDSPANGTRALGRQLMAYASRGLVTVSSIISTWAPSSENNTGAYVADVAAQLDVDADDSLDVRSRLPDLARAIARHENGYIDSSYDFTSWVYL